MLFNQMGLIYLNDWTSVSKFKAVTVLFLAEFEFITNSKIKSKEMIQK